MKISIQDYNDSGTVLLDRDRIDQLTRGNIIDAPITCVKTDPSVWLLPTAMQQNGDVFLSHTLVRGDLTDLENAEYCIINEHTLFDIPEHFQKDRIGRQWITNLLPVDGGTLAFLHTEYAGNEDYFGMPGTVIDGVPTKAPGRSCISLAWISAENLKSDIFRFQFLGHIATYCADMPHFNVSGTPVFVSEHEGIKYINLMFMDVKAKKVEDGWEKEATYIAQARSPLSDTVTKAKEGKLSQWMKRDNKEWKDAMGKQSTGVLPHVKMDDERISKGDIIVHSDAVYHSPSERYILFGYVLQQKNRNPSSIVMYSSKDGLEWDFEGVSSGRSDCIGGWSYIKEAI